MGYHVYQNQNRHYVHPLGRCNSNGIGGNPMQIANS